MVMATLAYLGSHWVLVIVVTLVVAGLGVAAYILKNLKFALAAIVIAVCGFAYQGAVTSGIQDQMNKDIAAQADLYKGRLNTLSDLALKNAAQAKIDADKIAELESKASETPKNDGACFDADAARRVSNIGKQNRKSVATGSFGHSGLFFKGSR
jgi:hypothetical protein